MKKTLLALCALAGFAVPADQLPCSVEKWDANPLAWTFDAAMRTVRPSGLDGLAIFDAPRSARVRISAKVTPEQAGTNSWATFGVALVDDDHNYWHAALVKAPPENGGRHFFELTEMRAGCWLAQHADKLAVTRQRQTAQWSFGETYEISIEGTTSGIAGFVKNAKGEVIWEMGYAYPKSAPDGTVKAVTCGRPALHANGGFRGTFAALDAVWAEVRPKSAAAIPPYASESFVPGVTEKATGFFRVVEKDGRWWVVDPLGRGTVLLGVDHVTYWGHHSQRSGKSHHHEVNKVKFPNKADWEADTLKRLKAWGFNLLGAGCDGNLKHRGLIHTVFLSVGDGLCWDGGNPDYYICPNEHRPCSAFPNVFHPDFAAWADYQARRKCAPHRNDPWLFGYFIDNELAWWGRGAQDTGLFDAVAKLPETHSAKIAQRAFLAEKGVTGEPSAEVKLAFLKRAADLYFRISSEAIRRHDPNHLVMGARFAGLGGAHPAVWEASGRYCDVVTFNCYPWADLDRNVVLTERGGNAKRITEAFTEQYGYVKRPMLVTEWSFPALDSGLPCTGGAGQRFQTQALRTQATELFAKTMLSLPFLVGYDYFMWVDEPPEGVVETHPEDTNYGLVSEQGKPYPLTEMFTKLHADIAGVRAAGLPAERPAPPRPKAPTTDEARAKFAVEKTTPDTAIKVPKPQVGKGPLFKGITDAEGGVLGDFTMMLSFLQDGSRVWSSISRVTEAQEAAPNRWRVVCEGQGRKGYAFAFTLEVTFFDSASFFLVDVVEVRNKGTKPLDMCAVYFRPQSPFALESVAKIPPNMWKRPCEARWQAADGRWFGARSTAATARRFSFVCNAERRSQHPDACFEPETAQVLSPGAEYRPNGTMWCRIEGGAHFTASR